MAAGIGLFGDRPIGWRFMSTVFGAMTLVGMYLWGLALFKDDKIALWIAMVTLFNNLLYVQARIGMLDTFMFGFLVLGLAGFTYVLFNDLGKRKNKCLLVLIGLMFGLAMACKWAAVVPWLMCIALALCGRVYKGFTRFSIPLVLVSLLVVPVITYFMSFIPLFLSAGPKRGFMDLFLMQKTMWEGQLRVVSSHPYMSKWTDWAVLRRPIWYAFDKENGPHQSFVRGVVLLGNPIVMWCGLAAILSCLWSWIKDRRVDAFLIAFFYIGFYLCWAAIPRKISFYYYYYPAGMTLSLALAYVFHYGEQGKLFKIRWARWTFLGAVSLLFVYFFPILAALKIPADSFRKWMWLSGWI